MSQTEKNEMTPMFTRILLVDDMGNDIREQIDKKIKCEVLTYPMDFLFKRLSSKTFFKGYDIFLFDASYKDEFGVPAISILEELIEKDKTYYNKSMVFVGKDFIEYSKTYDEQAFIGRLKRLPYAIYGDSYGSKLENMISFIKNQAQKNGMVVTDKLPEGNCRPELLEKIEEFRKPISQNIKEQTALAIKLCESLRGFEPQTEVERTTIESASQLAKEIMKSQHRIIQCIEIMHMDCTRAALHIEKGKKDAQPENEK